MQCNAQEGWRRNTEAGWQRQRQTQRHLTQRQSQGERLWKRKQKQGGKKRAQVLIDILTAGQRGLEEEK